MPRDIQKDYDTSVEVEQDMLTVGADVTISEDGAEITRVHVEFTEHPVDDIPLGLHNSSSNWHTTT